MKPDAKLDCAGHDIEDICMDVDDVAALPKILQGLEGSREGRSKPAEEVFDRLTAKYRAMQ